MKKYFWLLAFVIFFSCSQDRSYQKSQAHHTMSKPRVSNSPQIAEAEYSSADQTNELNKNVAINVQTPDFNRKMIKKANYKFEVKDVESTTAKVHQLAEKHMGFVANMDLSTTPTVMTNRMTIRVMNDQFEPLLNALGTEAIFVHHKKITSQDVTEQFVDLESRLKVKKEVKDRYTNMLRNDAKTLQQVLDAEEKIRVLQEEIESKEGRLRFLSDQVSLSEIQLEIFQQVEYEEKLMAQNKTFADKATDSFLNGWNSILGVALGMLNYWHFGLVLGIVWFNRFHFLNFIKNRN